MENDIRSSSRERKTFYDSDMIYSQDLDYLADELDTPFDADPVCTSTASATVTPILINEIVGNRKSPSSNLPKVNNERIKEILKCCLIENGYRYPMELLEACQPQQQDLLELANISNEQEALKKCCALAQKDYGNSRNYLADQVLGNRDLKILLGKAAPIVLAEKSNGMADVHQTHDLSESDKKVIYYLGGSIVKWILKQKRQLPSDDRLWCKAVLQQAENKLPEEYAGRDIDGKLISITTPFHQLSMAVEKEYQAQRTSRHVPEEEILQKVNVKNFIPNANKACTDVAIKRFVRMRAHFHTKQSIQAHTAKKHSMKKTNAIRKHLKLINDR